jgi:hypothetical protein
MSWQDWAVLMSLVVGLMAFYNTRVLAGELRKLSGEKD